MTLLTDVKEQRKLEQARGQPNLWFTHFSVPATFERVRSENFPDLSHDICVYSVNRGPLACIVDDESSATIYFHQLLNHGDTPVEVFSHIFKHELLHLRIQPFWHGKKWIQHTKEFWDAEKALSPERSGVWCWIRVNYMFNIKIRRRLERIDVLPNWKKRWNEPMADMATCQKLLRGKPKTTEDMMI